MYTSEISAGGAEKRRGEYFYTGDIFRIENDRSYFIGRRKSVIVGDSGENAYPEEIEEELTSVLMKVRQSCVFDLKGRAALVILQTDSLSEAPKTAVPTESSQTTALQEASVLGRATQTASFGKTATSNEDAKMAVSDDSAQAALFDFNESGQNLTPRAEPKAALDSVDRKSVV